jgi:hypothetical protein
MSQGYPPNAQPTPAGVAQGYPQGRYWYYTCIYTYWYIESNLSLSTSLDLGKGAGHLGDLEVFDHEKFQIQ